MVWARPGAPQAEQKGKRMVPDQIREQKTQHKTKNAHLAMHMTMNTSCHPPPHTPHTRTMALGAGGEGRQVPLAQAPTCSVCFLCVRARAHPHTRTRTHTHSHIRAHPPTHPHKTKTQTGGTGVFRAGRGRPSLLRESKEVNQSCVAGG